MSENNKIYRDTYELAEKLGEGGKGVVYLARHIRLDRKVVLKVERVDDPRRVSSREVDVLKLLKHRYIPSVYDYFVESDRTVTIMDYIQGESLDRPLKRGEVFTQAQVIGWTEQLLEALDYLHSPTHGDPPRGFVHSDIKPANIMRMPNGDVCLIDFNISLALGDERVSGYTPAYASPEHFGYDFSGTGRTGGLAGRRVRGFDVRTRTGVTSDKSTHKPADVSEKAAPEGSVTYDGSVTDDVTTDAFDSGTYVRANNIPNKDSVTDDTTECLTGGLTAHYAKSSSATSRAGEKPSDVWNVSGGRTSGKRIMPDVRSDIYCLGITMYYLLTGQSPRHSSSASKPETFEDFITDPLPADRFSKPFSDILAKAMEPDPEQRYASAAEMLEAVRMLRYNDPRVLRLKRSRRIVAAVFGVLLAAGLFTSFVGMERRNIEKTAMTHADRAFSLMNSGDAAGAITEALEALPARNALFAPGYLAKSELALAAASGVYDLRGGFADTRRVKLPAAPSFLRLSPDGSRGAAVCNDKLVIFSTADGSIIKELESEGSYLAEAEFVDDGTIAYAGKDGLTVYEIDSGKVILTGDPATAIAVSADGSTAAGVYKDSGYAKVYKLSDGSVRTVNFQGGYQKCPDELVKLNDLNAFELNGDGTALAVSLYYKEQGGSAVMLTDLNIGGISPRSSFSDMEKFSAAFSGGTLITTGAANGGRSEINIFRNAVGNEDTGESAVSDSEHFAVKSFGGRFYIRQGGRISIFGADSVSISGTLNNSLGVIDTGSTISTFDTDGKYVLLADKAGVSVYSVNGTKISYPKGSGRTADSNVCTVRNGVAAFGDMNSNELQIAAYKSGGGDFAVDYNADYSHSETRLSADGEHIMQFSSLSFRILDKEGNVIVGETALPENAADPQYRRDENGSCLEVTCTDGRVICYDGATGDIIGERQSDPPNLASTEFVTEKYRIVSDLGSAAAEVFDKDSGKSIGLIDKEDGDLAYVYEVGDKLLTQYIVKNGLSGELMTKGHLLNEKFEKIAEMDCLCDYIESTGTVLFDYPEGSIRGTKIYETDEIIEKVR